MPRTTSALLRKPSGESRTERVGKFARIWAQPPEAQAFDITDQWGGLLAEPRPAARGVAVVDAARPLCTDLKRAADQRMRAVPLGSRGMAVSGESSCENPTAEEST